MRPYLYAYYTHYQAKICENDIYILVTCLEAGGCTASWAADQPPARLRRRWRPPLWGSLWEWPHQGPDLNEIFILIHYVKPGIVPVDRLIVYRIYIIIKYRKTFILCKPVMWGCWEVLPPAGCLMSELVPGWDPSGMVPGCGILKFNYVYVKLLV